MRARLAAVAIALCCAACADETGMLIEIDSTLRVPDEVDRLELSVEGLDSGRSLERAWPLDSPFPQSYSVLPGGDADEQVRITVTAFLGDAFVLRRVVTASFQPGTVTQVPIALYAECAGIDCSAGVDCVAGRCTNAPLPDAGTADAGAPPPGCTSDESCDDGDPCNGREECEGGSCVSAGTPDCDDGIACTADTCASGACVHTPDDARCAAGDTCDAAAGCGGRACGGDADCTDGDGCNGEERCDDGVCRTGAMPDCDDGIACTIDACDAASGCTHASTDAVCDDGLFCNGAEVCGASGCGPGGAVSCDDANDCTDDYCSNMIGSCAHATRDVDGDGFGDAACGEVGGVPATDCNDRSGGVYPGAPEACDGTDQDCDGMVDEGCGAACDEACPGAAAATPGGRFTPVTSTSAQTGSCGGAGAEAILSFSLAVTSDVFITTHGSGVDTVLYVRSCTCGGTELACNDDADGLTTSVLQLRSLAPGTYNVFADTEVAMTSPLSIDLYATPAGRPANRCGRVVRMTAGSTSGNTCGGTSELGGRCEGSSDLDGPDDVYYFVVSGSARSVRADTCTGCTRFDTTLDIRSVCDDPSSSARVACDGDECRSSCVGGPRRQSDLTRSLPPGIYYVFVDGPAGECGDYTLTLSGL